MNKSKINLFIKTLIFSDFLILSGMGFINPIFAIYITDRINGSSVEIAGYAITILLVVKSLLQLPIAKYADKNPGEMDDWALIFYGAFFASIVNFLYLFIDSVWQLYLLQAIYGIATAMSYPSWFSLFSKHTDRTQAGFEWGFYSSVVGIGIAITGAIGGIIANRMGFDAVFILVGTVSLLGTALLLPLRKHVLAHDAQDINTRK